MGYVQDERAGPPYWAEWQPQDTYAANYVAPYTRPEPVQWEGGPGGLPSREAYRLADVRVDYSGGVNLHVQYERQPAADTAEAGRAFASWASESGSREGTGTLAAS